MSLKEITTLVAAWNSPYLSIWSIIKKMRHELVESLSELIISLDVCFFTMTLHIWDNAGLYLILRVDNAESLDSDLI